ncbi:MAG: ATPase, partial [Atopobiaceae bacterium]|nr:ATPase [Atopobiaceae bacterium]
AADAATRETSAHLDNALAFLDAAFGEGQEEVVFVSRLSVDPDLMRFVAAHGGESFVEHARQLMFHERGLDLLDQVDALRG